MKITVVGMGNAGTAISADLTRMGHQVTLLKTSNAIHSTHHRLLMSTSLVELHEKGCVQNVKLYEVTDDFSSAFKDAEIIFVFVQTTYHDQVIQKMLPFLQQDQIVVLEPGYLSTAYFINKQKDIPFAVVEATSTPVDCRIIQPGSVAILYRNVRNPIAVFPRKCAKNVMNKLEAIEYNFVLKSSVVEIALHNPNLIVHTAGGILSIPRVEKTGGEYYMYREVFTPSVWRVVEALDNEKMNLLGALGYERIPYVEACRERNSVDQTVDAKEVFFEYANTSNLKAPTSVYDRFITEDVPQGLVLLESFSKHLNLPTPVCTSLIEIASHALDIEFRDTGRSVEQLGKDAINAILKDSGFQGII
ncbi:MAG: NAD/NADP octopine/nopaline dehydrogenase family protein [Christensenellales bacterium]|jgi:opine dehydrogenase